jgi:peptidoglycan/LPS O-acetylase OafA/YrhL
MSTVQVPPPTVAAPMPPPPAPAPAARLSSLDGLRAVSALMVYLVHGWQDVFFGGFLGVEVFFVLSGYLITWLLIGEYRKTGGIRLGAFYARRALRLFPALVAVSAAGVAVGLVEGFGKPLDGLFSVTYLYDIYGAIAPHASALDHTWSLAVEEQFYLFWPALLVFGLARRWPMRAVTLGLALAGLALVVWQRDAAKLQILPFTHLPQLAAGILIAMTVRTDGGRERVRRASGMVPTLLALGVIAVATLRARVDWWWVYPVAAVVCMVPVAHLVTHAGSAVSRALSHPWLVWLGQRSYGFYLWHFVILVSLQHHLHFGIAMALGFPITLVATELSWRYVESPFLRRKRRFEAGEPAVVAVS